jgi:dsDNA-binding SOS-regulon protein
MTTMKDAIAELRAAADEQFTLTNESTLAEVNERQQRVGLALSAVREALREIHDSGTKPSPDDNPNEALEYANAAMTHAIAINRYKLDQIRRTIAPDDPRDSEKPS